ncbi:MULTISPECIES: class I SAM-dependent methyltransferase [Flavobacteriaceae]|uniref:Class I SAM-dependent methyltransferase n=2 Tax=Flavobacteriaceae TaxID=49546 RepID=A0A4Y8AW45_9FLAO|nr:MULTISPECIES: class I SAM-dependent methyltransferase [Flavobacteriaceae]TEW76737.1 class I SAM-dependent methyltransferase [Gramella jeungdoensis]GGK50466.1 hypothetical protein GCM10007963_18520 [Lutibacter litoralis]
MNLQTLKKNIEGIDIYILDQILKERYQPKAKILDAGCGSGRNLKWFYNNGFEIHGTDTNQDQLQICKELYVEQQANFIQSSIKQMPYTSDSFDHLICNAVLHFAEDLNEFLQMFEELLRVLKPQGSLFIRVASNFGIENQLESIKSGVYKLPDGSTRFLLTPQILADLQANYCISWLEDVKTTIVHNKRSITTLVIKKEK